MSASSVEHSAAQWTTAPVIDYEPAPEPLGSSAPTCPAPTLQPAHRPAQRPLARRKPPRPPEPAPPRTAVVFAETALRQIVEVIDRRRPVSQLRALMTPVLVEAVIVRAAAARRGTAKLGRVRARSVDTGAAEVAAAEIFATFLRCGRVHAVAGRIERHRGGWRIVALQIG
ncbi:MAG: Rv3235 family protein [Actinomycetota bacterium]|nr:Rv3235 family protein [Actinomycetota bacterium]